jgi:hypothetical protein
LPVLPLPEPLVPSACPPTSPCHNEEAKKGEREDKEKEQKEKDEENQDGEDEDRA